MFMRQMIALSICNFFLGNYQHGRKHLTLIIKKILYVDKTEIVTLRIAKPRDK